MSASSLGSRPEALGYASASASASENHATTPAFAPPPPPPPPPPPRPPRSCVVCRRRKVRCDKLSPCSNCRRANIPCVFPSADRPPRWARRLGPLTSHGEHDVPTSASASAGGASQSREPDSNPGPTIQVMERLRTLEGLVRALSSQLEQANANTGSSVATSAGESPASAAGPPEGNHLPDSRPVPSAAGAQKDVGKLFVRDADASRSRYISSGFWSRINDELDGLRTDLGGGDNDDGSEDEDESPGHTASTHQTPSERHAFLFRHQRGDGIHLNAFHPLPSQVPYILNIFADNVNYFVQIIHMPTLRKQLTVSRGGGLSTLPICTQALFFSICFAAVTSMEDDDVLINFGTPKADLSLQYRLGLEHALGQADFLNHPDLALVQAFTIFLALVRRHDSPRYVWMLTGLAIRMAHALGLHRDGAHFAHLTPFEVEMRRRVWYAVCSLDLRASEDQGTEVTIARSSYDTRLPLNINDADIDPDSQQTPPERPGLSDCTVARLMYQLGDLSRQMIAPGTTRPEQDALVQTMSELFDRGYRQHTTEPESMAAWMGTTCLKLVVAKMTLLVYLPRHLASSSSSPPSSLPPDRGADDQNRTQLLVAAIEVAEYNHALNAQEACRQWRWIYQTYTHWYAIVYLLVEIIRRPLSPLVERAWLALHSRWLIPAPHTVNATTSSHVWVPLRRIMARARQHRKGELRRLRGDARAVRALEEADREAPVPGSEGPFAADDLPSTAEKSKEQCLAHWRRLVAASPEEEEEEEEAGEHDQATFPGAATAAPEAFPSPHPGSNAWPNVGLGSGWVPSGASPLATATTTTTTTTHTPRFPARDPAVEKGRPTEPSLLGSWAHEQTSHPGHVSMPWLWADAEPAEPTGYGYSASDVNMDVDGDMDWMAWMDSAKNFESSHGI